MGADLVIESSRPDTGEALALIRALDEDLRARYRKDETYGLRPEDLHAPLLIFLVARVGRQPVGCGAVRPLEPGVGEIKRMFVLPDWRGRGIGRGLLSALETHARAIGYSRLRLETGTLQPEAVGLYRSAGYENRAAFGEYLGHPQSVFLEKALPDP